MLPADHFPEDLLDRLLVADQVVVDDEGDAQTGLPHRIEFGQHLGGRLDPGTAAKGHDDVTEFALKGTAARELEATEGVPLHLQQVEPRRGNLGHVRLLKLLVAALVQALCPLTKKLRPGLFGLANEDHVRQTLKIIFFHRDPGTAHHHETAALLQFGDDLGHPEPLHAEPGHPHDVGRVQRSQSIGSTISSINVIVCSAGVSAASSGRQATGRFADLLMNGNAWSIPQ